MLPLSPPPKYWENIHSLISKFLWKGKRPRISLATLQRFKCSGGLSVPNFKYYYWAFILRSLSTWFCQSNKASWKNIEENLVHPHRLTDVIYSSISLKQAKARFGPIITNLISVWRTVEKESKTFKRWHKNNPLLYNYSLLLGAKPFKCPSWGKKGIHVLGDIFNDTGLLSFNDLCSSFSLSMSTFFLYLQLRSSMKVNGVPWNEPLTTHKLHDVLHKNNKKNIVSKLYNLLYNLLLITNYKSHKLKKCGVMIYWSNWTMTAGNIYGIQSAGNIYGYNQETLIINWYISILCIELT